MSLWLLSKEKLNRRLFEINWQRISPCEIQTFGRFFRDGIEFTAV
jgi:hypothetical protein